MVMTATVDELIRVRLRRIRKSRGLKSKDVARLAGMPPSSYSAIENGQNGLKVARLVAVLDALQLDIADVWPWESLDLLLEAQRKAQLKRQSFCLQDIADLIDADGAALFYRDGSSWRPVLCAGIPDELALRMSFCPLSGPSVVRVTVSGHQFCFVPVAVRSEISSHFLQHMVSRVAGVIASDPVLMRTAIESQAQA